MSTRAIYTFKDSRGSYHVYKHHDGYPEGGVGAILAALPLSWGSTRFEADDLGAAFIAANKTGGGGVRLMPSGKWKDVAPGDIEFRYEIYMKMKSDEIHVAIYAVDQDWKTEAWTESKLFDGTLADAAKFAKVAITA